MRRENGGRGWGESGSNTCNHASISAHPHCSCSHLRSSPPIYPSYPTVTRHSSACSPTPFLPSVSPPSLDSSSCGLTRGSGPAPSIPCDGRLLSSVGAAGSSTFPPRPGAMAQLVLFDLVGVLISSRGLILLTFALVDAETEPRGFAKP
ncbi:hypothetical protein K437DRAFT_185389 [Tilletiaria anomala UBC 951]|uniref:Uncharacterized protein n=1 Tax=Tilletiaria anomala (strain ATCC 24038 / CBS 436.72 / UBC 951) TaxID=1037660 RepID=A0A066VPU7_TILAU|nr:uncharacterized protein K437DRAFT_185389 [Tilletiaria anomala UBC 951]KDN40615.1 hypothetical protein K437DRAFT_185389 [Tilletiaria anomala UBC 951]